MAERILTLYELNRATLARQFLLERVSQTPLDAIKQLVALQGQMSNAPYIDSYVLLPMRQRRLRFSSANTTVVNMGVAIFKEEAQHISSHCVIT